MTNLHTTNRAGWALVVLAGLMTAATHAEAAPKYTVTDLGTLPGGDYYYPRGINASGQIVGTASGIGSFLYSGGKLTKLEGGQGLGINDAGQVTRLGEVGINNAGDTVAEALDGMNSIHAIVTVGGKSVDLGADAMPTNINNLGQAVGKVSQPDGRSHPFLYSDGKMTDLGLLPNALSAWATAINDSGEVVGGPFNDGSGAHAFLFSGGSLHDLGSLGGESSAFGINNHGQIVGTAEVGSESEYHAFLAEHGRMLDLNSLIAQDTDWILRTATGINDAGQITGYGYIDGVQHAFVLNPTIVPEPSTLALLLISLGVPCAHRIIRHVRGKASE